MAMRVGSVPGELLGDVESSDRVFCGEGSTRVGVVGCDAIVVKMRR
jgi:hypothetical protein